MPTNLDPDQPLLAGLIGDPVTHSRSPMLHNAAFAKLGIHARYELWPTSALELAARVDSLRAPHILGANVTLPHKIAVLQLLDRLDPAVELIGAANTIIREADGSLTGANTDAPAFLASLREEGGYDPAGQTIVILGASGAARAAAMALAGAGVARLVIANRTIERAEALLGDLLAATDADPLLFALTPRRCRPARAAGRGQLDRQCHVDRLAWRSVAAAGAADPTQRAGVRHDLPANPAAARRGRVRGAHARRRGHAGAPGRAGFRALDGQSAPLDVMRAALDA